MYCWGRHILKLAWSVSSVCALWLRAQSSKPFLVDSPEPVHDQFLIAGLPGTATDNFLKRWIAFMIGGVIAIAVEVILLPVKARTRMVESLADALHHVNEMENCIAAGIEEGKNFDLYNTDRVLRFENARRMANGALGAAETFCQSSPSNGIEARAANKDQCRSVAQNLESRGLSRV